MARDRWLGQWGRRVNQSLHIKLVTSLLILVILVMLGLCMILFSWFFFLFSSCLSAFVSVLLGLGFWGFFVLFGFEGRMCLLLDLVSSCISAERDGSVGVLHFPYGYTKLLHCWLLLMPLACNTELNMTV